MQKILKKKFYKKNYFTQKKNIEENDFAKKKLFCQKILKKLFWPMKNWRKGILQENFLSKFESVWTV